MFQTMCMTYLFTLSFAFALAFSFLSARELLECALVKFEVAYWSTILTPLRLPFLVLFFFFLYFRGFQRRISFFLVSSREASSMATVAPSWSSWVTPAWSWWEGASSITTAVACSCKWEMIASKWDDRFITFTIRVSFSGRYGHRASNFFLSYLFNGMNKFCSHSCKAG